MNSQKISHRYMIYLRSCMVTYSLVVVPSPSYMQMLIKFIQEDFRIALFMKPCLLVLVPVNARQKEKNNLQLQSLTDKKRDLSSL